MIRSSVLLHGMHLVWIKRGQTTELALFMVLSINNTNQQLKYLIKIQYLKKQINRSYDNK